MCLLILTLFIPPRATHGSFPIGFISNWVVFQLGSILISFLPKDLPS